MKKVLLFSSLRKKRKILELSLNSMFNLIVPEQYKIDILVQDDNDDVESKEYISSLISEKKLISLDFYLSDDNYKGDHLWNISQVNRISGIKNAALRYGLENGYDYVFLVDADLVLNRNTLDYLLKLNKDFVFEVFWTLFFNENYYKPNAWDYHSWSYNGPETIINLSNEGTYVVGGGGACTLLSRDILLKGLTFDRLPSLKYSGEDRHFCTRAQALGYNVMADTHFPAFHIFLETQYPEAKEWYQNGADPGFFKIWLDEKWKTTVLKSFSTPNNSFFNKVRRFQYEVRKSFQRNFLHD
jgi:hypothetical protein